MLAEPCMERGNQAWRRTIDNGLMGILQGHNEVVPVWYPRKTYGAGRRDYFLEAGWGSTRDLIDVRN